MTDVQRGPRPPVVGMVGAGQLARMTCQAAIGLDIGFRVLAASPGDSAALVCADVTIGDHTDAEALLAFARGCDVVTFDHELVQMRARDVLMVEGHHVAAAGERKQRL